jgi:pimeloyl-ACP methyl ester carboxylesterase
MLSVALLSIVLALATTVAGASAGSNSGHWVGSIEGERSSTALILDLGVEGTSRASLPDLALYDLSIVQHDRDDGLDLRASFHGQAFHAVLRRSGVELTGVASAGARTADIRLRRTGPGEALRYREEPVNIAGGIKLIGATLFLPLSRAPHAAVVLVHGSHGPSRDDLRGPAILFARSGIAALTYDKRDLGSDQSLPHRYGFLELADDAVRAVNALAARSDIDRRHVGIWGISEGGWIAPAIASRSPLVSFLIAVSAPAVSYAAVITATTRRGLARHKFSRPEIAEATGALERVFAFVRHGGNRAALDALLASVPRRPWGGALSITLPGHAPTAEEVSHEVRWRELDVDPSVWWRQVHVPVFAVWGGEDDHPVTESVEVIRNALASAGNRDATLIVYPHGDHQLLENSEAAGSWPRMTPGFIDAMIGWTRKRTGLVK